MRVGGRARTGTESRQSTRDRHCPGCWPRGDPEGLLPCLGCGVWGLSQGLDVLGGSQQLPMLSWLFSVVRRQGRTAEGEMAPETLTISHHHPLTFTHPVTSEVGDPHPSKRLDWNLSKRLYTFLKA